MITTKQPSLKWKVEFTKTADKAFEKIDKSITRSINRYIFERLATAENPQRLGKPLTGNLKNFWRYRIGDYRLVCSIQDERLLIVVVHVAHRKEVYENIHFLKSSS